MNKIHFLIIGLVVFISCEVKPVEIVYGSDACHFCKMTIVDQQHSAEIVTIKGKAFKYDAIECMMNDLTQWDKPEPSLFLVADFATPGMMVNAQESHYLISEAIPSPMGANLSAFQIENSRDDSLNKLGGEDLDWKLLSRKYQLSE